MSLTAPPRPREVDAPPQPDPLEALIEEARQRARRRRRRGWGAVVALVAIAGVFDPHRPRPRPQRFGGRYERGERPAHQNSREDAQRSARGHGHGIADHGVQRVHGLVRLLAHPNGRKPGTGCALSGSPDGLVWRRREHRLVARRHTPRPLGHLLRQRKPVQRSPCHRSGNRARHNAPHRWVLRLVRPRLVAGWHADRVCKRETSSTAKTRSTSSTQGGAHPARLSHADSVGATGPRGLPMDSGSHSRVQWMAGVRSTSCARAVRTSASSFRPDQPLTGHPTGGRLRIGRAAASCW